MQIYIISTNTVYFYEIFFPFFWIATDLGLKSLIMGRV